MKLALLSLSFVVLSGAMAVLAQPPTQSLIPPGSVAVTSAQQVPPIDMTKAVGYQIGPGDELTIKVVGEPDFDFASRVDEDGKISIPFDEQPLDARCKTERQLRADMKQVLSKYLRNPQFNLRVTDQNSRPPATVYGEVKNPQQVKLMRRASLVELLAVAGGTTEDAAGVVQVFRTETPICTADDKDAIWTTNSTDAIAVPSRIYSLAAVREGREAANPSIYPGDVIVVQKAAPVYVIGEVNAPQGIYLKEGGTSLMDAVAKVSGVRQGAKTKDVKIYRLKKNASKESVTDANLSDRDVLSANLDEIKAGRQKDLMLEAYDIVQVDKATPSIGKTILDLAVGAGRGAIGSVSSGIGYRVLY
jgi:polysaccharide export outer membrane protein